MALSIAHHQSAINPQQIPGSITVGWTPTPGNLLLIFLHCNLPNHSAVVNTTDWTDLADAVATADQVGMLLGRYVQIGDTSALPVLWTAGTTYWAYEVYEIAGVSGSFSTDIGSQIDIVGNTGAVASFSTGTLTTTANGTLALVGAGQYDGTTDPTLSAGWTTDEFGHNASNYGSTISGSMTGVASGTNVSATFNFTSVENPSDSFLVLITPSSAASVTLTGVSAACAAHSVTTSRGKSIAVTGVASLALAGTLTPRVNARAPGVSATGAPGRFTPTHAPVLHGVSAVGGFSPVRAQGDPGLDHVFSFAEAGQVGVYATPIAYLPAARIMRNTPVAAQGAMDNTPVALISRLYPSGPRPVSRTITLVGVASATLASQVSGYVQMGTLVAQAASQCAAGAVTTSIM